MDLMAPLDSLFLAAETREHPLHVGALQLFSPPADAGPTFVRDIHEEMLQCNDIAPPFRKLPMTFHGALANTGWSSDNDVDPGYHCAAIRLAGTGTDP